MTETIKVEVDESLARRFRKRAMEKYGDRKGAIKKALEEAMKNYISSGEVEWTPLLGTLKSKLSSVELQHSAWRKVD